jgi:ethanolamine utilization microcompartment shell protein EutS
LARIIHSEFIGIGNGKENRVVEEQTFLNEDNVTITNSRFIVPGQTYTVNTITSVKNLEISPSRKGPIILGAIGILCLLPGETGTIVLGVLLLACAIAWFVMQKSTYTVVLSSASGEIEAISTKDFDFASRIIKGLNDAIVARG